jgi:group I intron endonuclease
MEYEVYMDKSKVVGQIYLMTNTITNMNYVGQTWTHRKNRGKYKPFGYEGRFRDHISEALCNTKKKQCRYLNNAIRHYGKDAFTVTCVYTCPLDELDDWEKYYIKTYNTMYPNGYNLTDGGKSHIRLKSDCLPLETKTPKKRGGSTMRTEETRKKMSERLREVMNTDENKRRQMLITKQQHMRQKYEKFKGEQFDVQNLDQYIHIKHSNGQPVVVVNVNEKRTSFVGKYETLEQLINHAQEFLTNLAYSATLSNCGEPVKIQTPSLYENI